MKKLYLFIPELLVGLALGASLTWLFLHKEPTSWYGEDLGDLDYVVKIRTS